MFDFRRLHGRIEGNRMIDATTGFYETLYAPEESFFYRDFVKEEKK